MEIPARHNVTARLRERYGNEATEVGRYLNASDPLSDSLLEAFDAFPPGVGMAMLEQALDEGIEAVPDAPADMRELFRQIDEVPAWVDWDEIGTGGRMFLRSGMFGALVMACRSLPLCYASPSGNKPLVMSGKIVSQASPRLAETGRFIFETCRDGGVRRFSPGLKSTIEVRLRHSRVRKILLQSGHWRGEEWGHPINQSDLAATNLMFSLATIDGLREIGFRVSPEESRAFIRLWRYSGYLLGIDPALLCRTEEEARRLTELLLDSQGAPDADSRELVGSLLKDGIYTAFLRRYKVGRVVPGAIARSLLFGFSGKLLGTPLADSLGYPRSRWAPLSVPASKGFISLLELGRVCLPGGTAAAVTLGEKMLANIVATSLTIATETRSAARDSAPARAT